MQCNRCLVSVCRFSITTISCWAHTADPYFDRRSFIRPARRWLCAFRPMATLDWAIVAGYGIWRIAIALRPSIGPHDVAVSLNRSVAPSPWWIWLSIIRREYISIAFGWSNRPRLICIWIHICCCASIHSTKWVRCTEDFRGNSKWGM